MAEVIITNNDNEELDSALKRLARQVGREGQVKKAKRRYFGGFLTKSKRRRGKKLASRRRLQRFLRNQPPKSDFDSVKARFWCNEDVNWATGPDTWKPDLTPIRMPKSLESPAGPASRFRFGEDRRKGKIEKIVTEPLPPSIHVCGIAEYSYRHKTSGKVTGIIIVRSKNDDGDPREKYSFPGGGVEVEKGETPEQAIVREFKEETGLIVALPEESQRIFTTRIKNAGDDHTFICFLLRVIGGRPKPGEEIVELKLAPFERLEKFVFETHGLSFNHLRSFRAYDEKKKTGTLPALPKISRATKKEVAKEVADVSAEN
jgi:ribosomal protein S21